jgi:hypothetical protein
MLGSGLNTILDVIRGLPVGGGLNGADTSLAGDRGGNDGFGHLFQQAARLDPQTPVPGVMLPPNSPALELQSLPHADDKSGNLLPPSGTDLPLEALRKLGMNLDDTATQVGDQVRILSAGVNDSVATASGPTPAPLLADDGMLSGESASGESASGDAAANNPDRFRPASNGDAVPTLADVSSADKETALTSAGLLLSGGKVMSPSSAPAMAGQSLEQMMPQKAGLDAGAVNANPAVQSATGQPVVSVTTSNIQLGDSRDGSITGEPDQRLQHPADRTIPSSSASQPAATANVEDDSAVSSGRDARTPINAYAGNEALRRVASVPSSSVYVGPAVTSGAVAALAEPPLINDSMGPDAGPSGEKFTPDKAAMTLPGEAAKIARADSLATALHAAGEQRSRSPVSNGEPTDAAMRTAAARLAAASGSEAVPAKPSAEPVQHGAAVGSAASAVTAMERNELLRRLTPVTNAATQSVTEPTEASSEPLNPVSSGVSGRDAQLVGGSSATAQPMASMPSASRTEDRISGLQDDGFKIVEEYPADDALKAESHLIDRETSDRPAASATRGPEVALSATAGGVSVTAVAGSRGLSTVVPPTETFLDALQQTPDAPEFPEELLGRVRLLQANGQREARLNLHPAELGRLTISVSTEGDTARVAFTVDNPQAREAIELAMPRLRELLGEAGLQLADSSVSEQHSGGAEAREGKGSEEASTARQLATDDDPTATLGDEAPHRPQHGDGLFDAYA